MVTEEQEQKLLDQYGEAMADSLVAKAQELQIDLRPLLDTGYAWFDWLTETFGEKVRDKAFWGLSHQYAEEMLAHDPANPGYEARRWQVALHAIHLIGTQLYPPSLIRWDENNWLFGTGGTSHWERSFPVVQDVNDTLITVYYVSRIDQFQHGWRGTLYAISIEHLTEFDWIEFTDLYAERGNYTLNDILFDLVLEGCGVCLWISAPLIKSRDECQEITRKRAEYMANNFAWIMNTYHENGILRLDQLRAVGGEHAWVELPEYRKSFSINKTDQDQAERHSIRVYQYGNARYTLDRCLSLDPPGYVLYYQDKQHRDITPVIQVDGFTLWGSGIAWSKAEMKAKEAVQKRTWRNV